MDVKSTHGSCCGHESWRTKKGGRDEEEKEEGGKKKRRIGEEDFVGLERRGRER